MESLGFVFEVSSLLGKLADVSFGAFVCKVAGFVAVITISGHRVGLKGVDGLLFTFFFYHLSICPVAFLNLRVLLVRWLCEFGTVNLLDKRSYKILLPGRISLFLLCKRSTKPLKLPVLGVFFLGGFHPVVKSYWLRFLPPDGKENLFVEGCLVVFDKKSIELLFVESTVGESNSEFGIMLFDSVRSLSHFSKFVGSYC